MRRYIYKQFKKKNHKFRGTARFFEYSKKNGDFTNEKKNLVVRLYCKK